MKDAHVKQEQYYPEYLKFSCDPTCDECEEEGWTGGIPITRSPLKVISPLDGGGQEVILTLIQGGGVQLYFKAYFANFRPRPPPPPLQIIIAQSLSPLLLVFLGYWSKRLKSDFLRVPRIGRHS